MSFNKLQFIFHIERRKDYIHYRKIIIIYIRLLYYFMHVNGLSCKISFSWHFSCMHVVRHSSFLLVLLLLCWRICSVLICSFTIWLKRDKRRILLLPSLLLETNTLTYNFYTAAIITLCFFFSVLLVFSRRWNGNDKTQKRQKNIRKMEQPILKRITYERDATTHRFFLLVN